MYDQNRDVKSARWDKDRAASKNVEAELMEILIVRRQSRTLDA
jgi:hypothetical protein